MKFRKLNEELYINHDTLNPVLWDNYILNSEVKEKILQLVDEFQNTLDIPLKVLDIEIVGSNASYNYTDKSDIDVHIVTNFELYGYPVDLVDAAMNSFKSNFNNKYDINYGGFNVELYVEDIKTTPQSNGIYSVINDRWIKQPKKLPTMEVELEPEYTNLYNKVNNLINDENTTVEDITSFIDELYVLRRESLLSDGEFGKYNLIFKKLRNEGLLDKVKEKRIEITSKELSI